MIFRGFAVLAVALLSAGGAQARGYDCLVPADRPEGRPLGMGQALTMQVMNDIAAQGIGAPAHYRYRVCGSIQNGQQKIMIGFIALKGTGPVCDAPENFALFYDPTARTFGAPIRGVTFCAPPPAKPAP